MTTHDHAAFVEGCFRCDLSRGEVVPEAVEVAAVTFMDVDNGRIVTSGGWEIAPGYIKFPNGDRHVTAEWLEAELAKAHAAGRAEGVAAVKAAVEGLAEAALVNASVYELTESSVDVEDLYVALASVDGAL